MASNFVLEDGTNILDLENSEDRIAARRQRIKQKQNTKQSVNTGEVVVPKETHLPTLCEVQTRRSDQMLTKIAADSSALVRNVREASLLDEVKRMTRSRYHDDRRAEKLEQEKETGGAHCREIGLKWKDISKVKAPTDLYQKLMDQKVACDAVIAEKDKLIRELKEEIEEDGEDYSDVINREEEEFQMTVDRAFDQIKLMTTSYNSELNNIEAALVTEWEQLNVTHRGQWDGSLKKINVQDEERLTTTRAACQKSAQELDELRQQKASEYSKMRNDMDKDVQTMELYLQKLKALLRLNQEKLEYGCQVLRKRDEEQIIVKSNLKRKMTKIQDTYAIMKKKVENTEKANKEKERKAQVECQKLEEQMRDLEKKFRHFQAVDNKKFNDLWAMTDYEARKLANELVAIDGEIHRKLLKRPWQKPTLFFEDIEDDNLQQELERGKDEAVRRFSQKVASFSAPAACRRHHISSQTLFKIGLMAVRSQSSPFAASAIYNGQPGTSGRQLEISHGQRKEILCALVAEAAFLVDGKSGNVVAAIPEDRQILMKLDAILTMLKINSEQELDALVRYLYVNCYRKRADKFDHRAGRKSILPPITDGVVSPSSEELGQQMVDVNGGNARCSFDQGAQQATNILEFVYEFLEQRNQKRIFRSRAIAQKPSPIKDESRISNEKIESYWPKFETVIPEDRKELWTVLRNGLEKFRKLEVEHDELQKQVDHYRKQNGELKALLERYMNQRSYA